MVNFISIAQFMHNTQHKVLYIKARNHSITKQKVTTGLTLLLIWFYKFCLASTESPRLTAADRLQLQSLHKQQEHYKHGPEAGMGVSTKYIIKGNPTLTMKIKNHSKINKRPPYRNQLIELVLIE